MSACERVPVVAVVIGDSLEGGFGRIMVIHADGISDHEDAGECGVVGFSRVFHRADLKPVGQESTLAFLSMHGGTPESSGEIPGSDLLLLIDVPEAAAKGDGNRFATNFNDPATGLFFEVRFEPSENRLLIGRDAGGMTGRGIGKEGHDARGEGIAFLQSCALQVVHSLEFSEDFIGDLIEGCELLAMGDFDVVLPVDREARFTDVGFWIVFGRLKKLAGLGVRIDFEDLSVGSVEAGEGIGGEGYGRA